MEAVSLLGKYMSKYGGHMFITKKEALDMDVHSLSLWELEAYKIRVLEFMHKKSCRKAEKENLQEKLNETVEFINDIYMEKCGFLYKDIEDIRR